MAVNTKDGRRIGAIKNRSQTYNPKTNRYIKRNTETGQFMSSSKTKYKSVRTEKSSSKTTLKTTTKK